MFAILPTPQSHRVLLFVRRAKRAVWWIATWLIGARACDTIRPLFGTPVGPSTHQVIVIVLLALVAGAVGGALLVGRGWEGVAFASIIGTAIWSLAFVSEIPTTYAVCGADAVGGCDHIIGFWWVGTALGASIPVATGLLVTTFVWWAAVPRTRRARIESAVTQPSPPPTGQQIAWARFKAGDDARSD